MDDGNTAAPPAVSIVPTIPAHINALKANLRPEDAAEILRFGITINKALWYSYKHSLIRKTAMIDGEVVACWGLHGTFLGNTGQPWLMTTPGVKKVSPLKFTRIYQQEVMEMLKIFPKLVNYVDSGYANAVRLLEIIGFVVEEPKKMGTENGLYRKFVMGK